MTGATPLLAPYAAKRSRQVQRYPQNHTVALTTLPAAGVQSQLGAANPL